MQERNKAREKGTGQWGIYGMIERLRGREEEVVQGEERTDLDLFTVS